MLQRLLISLGGGLLGSFLGDPLGGSLLGGSLRGGFLGGGFFLRHFEKFSKTIFLKVMR